MEDSEDFTAQTTARDKYNMEEKTESMLEKAERAAARRANAKKYAFTCYMCWKHGTRFLDVKDRGIEGPAQFEIICWKCKTHPKKGFASFEQMEKFARAYPNVEVFESPPPPPVWPPEPPEPVIQSEAARANFEKLFGKI